MASDATRMCELLVGLGDVRVLAVTDADAAGLVVTVETVEGRDWCRSCGLRAVAKDRPTVLLGDLPCFGRPATLAWRKRRWSCPAGCGGWTERNEAIAAPRCALTRRAGLWATEQVGRLARPVSQVAAELGVAWHTVMDAVVIYGTQLVEDPDRIGGVAAIGVDETKWLTAKAKAPTRWASAVVDVERPRVIDLLEGRNAADLTRWLAAQAPGWRASVTVAACDLHEPFRAAFDDQLPHATQVADPFHVLRARYSGSAIGLGAGSRTRPSATAAAPPTRCIGPASC